jgi:thiol-disulfide isomerase/thioredoxin
MKRIHLLFWFGLALVLATAGLPGCNSRKGGKAAAAETSSKSAPVNEPNVTFKDLQGNSVTLDSFKGKVVLVNFWATWCEPCKIEIPWMIGYQEKYASRGFTVLGVAMDDEGKSVVEPFVQKQQFDVDGKKMSMNYPIVLGNDDIADKFGGLIGFPTTWLISRDAKVVKRVIGIVNESEMDKEIQSLL